MLSGGADSGNAGRRGKINGDPSDVSVVLKLTHRLEAARDGGGARSQDSCGDRNTMTLHRVTVGAGGSGVGNAESLIDCTKD